MRQADRIRIHSREKYVLPARDRKERRFSIRTGDVLRDLQLVGSSAPAVCSALKTKQFLEANALRLVSRTAPPSGQSTTVTYTYEFQETHPSPKRDDAFLRLRGALKDVFAELGGGEAYLRAEREAFVGPK